MTRSAPLTALGLMLLLGCSATNDDGSTANAGGNSLSNGGTQNFGGSTGNAGTGSGTSGTDGSGVAGNSAGGSAGSAGSVGVAGSGGSNTAGASAGGAAGEAAGGAAGSSGSGGSAGSGQQPPMLNIDPGRMNREDIQFNVTDADATASGFHGGGQLASFDGSKTVQGYLVVTMGGIGGGPHTGGAYQWAVGRGFHAIAVDMFNATGGEGNGGLVYCESWSGQDLTPAANVSPQNGVMNRVKTALPFLALQDPGANWDYYLDSNGDVIWDRVILFGYSYGAQTAVAATKFVAVHRVVATSGPNFPTGEASSSWITDMPNLSDVNGLFAINDDETEFWQTLTTMGWIGPATRVMEGDDVTIEPPFNGTHMLDVPGGHTEFCSLPKIGYDKVCDFAFGVIP